MASEPGEITWLLEGDPAIRWQTLRDLVGASPVVVEEERQKTTSAGWGFSLLAQQNADGLWGGGFYSPKWTSTTYTLLLLRSIGLPPTCTQVHKGLERLIEKGEFTHGGINLFSTIKHSDICVDGMVLALLAYFYYPTDLTVRLASHLLAHQMEDGGWNCMATLGTTHSSFHTTISVLEGIREFEKNAPVLIEPFVVARRKGEEFLLQHRLFRSHRSGIIVDPKMVRFSFPPRWRYDILRALDYFQDSGASYDPRMSDAVSILLQKRLSSGCWNLENNHPGKSYFEMEQVGVPSRWNTLRALRVLKWLGKWDVD
jgi:hypothetical protein